MKIYYIEYKVDETLYSKIVIADNVKEAKKFITDNYICAWAYVEFIDICETEIKKGILY